MKTFKLSIIYFISIICFAQLASAQVKDTVLKPIDSIGKVVKPKVLERTGPKSKLDTVKSAYVNPGKVAARQAVYRSMIIPGWGQVYNIRLLKDGYGERGGKSQVLQKVYTFAKIGAIYGGFGALTVAYIDARKNYKLYLTELQYRFDNEDQADPNGPFGSRYTTAGITNGKNTFKRNSQIVIFSYGLVYIANILDAYVAARLHFFNVDDNLGMRFSPSLQNVNSLYGNNYIPSVKVALTF